MTSIALSTSSGTPAFQSYFEKIVELNNSGMKFPVNLDSVWAICYARKDDAVRELKKNYYENIDYQFIRRNAENQKSGRPADVYALSVPCLEYFIARRVRAVFEVYRRVFHDVINSAFKVPQTFAEALKLAYENQISLDKADEKIKELQPAAEAYGQLMDTNNLYPVGDAAKVLNLSFGEITMFDLLRRDKFLMSNNMPYQEYINAGYFVVRAKTYKKPDGSKKAYSQTYVTTKGLDWLRKKYSKDIKPVIVSEPIQTELFPE